MLRFAPAKNLGHPLKRIALCIINPRTQLATLTLFAILQKSPALARVFNGLKFSVEPATRILQKLAVTAASLGSYQALSGATTAIYDTTPNAPFAFDIGDTVTIAFGVSNTAANASSWSVGGNLPPGLTISGTQGAPLSNQGVFNNRFGQITGSPTQAGTFTFSIKPWSNLNGRGHTAEALEMTITVNAPPLVSPKANMTSAPNSFTITWSTQPNQDYQIQISDNPLDEQSWTPFQASIETDGDQQSVTLEKASLPTPLLLRIATSHP